MNDQNQNISLEIAAQAEVWQNLKLALIFTSALINLYALIALTVVISLN